MQTLIITSTAFEPNGTIPAKYTCDGRDINPPLRVERIPSETQSLALIMDDPDAPSGVWDHWIKWNIEIPKGSSSFEIREATEPEGVPGKGSGGSLRYQGPCPPEGTHRYFFKVYALDILLDLPEGASKKEVETALLDHVLAEGKLVGNYERTTEPR
jgi:Raf kinase inhibitor-like YbhB/YbcL family protein